MKQSELFSDWYKRPGDLVYTMMRQPGWDFGTPALTLRQRLYKMGALYPVTMTDDLVAKRKLHPPPVGRWAIPTLTKPGKHCYVNNDLDREDLQWHITLFGLAEGVNTFIEKKARATAIRKLPDLLSRRKPPLWARQFLRDLDDEERRQVLAKLTYKRHTPLEDREQMSLPFPSAGGTSMSTANSSSE